MKIATHSQARSNLAKAMDRVCTERAPLVTTRKNAQSVVLISLLDYHEVDTTAYLVHSPVNARRLREAMAELATGGGSERAGLV